MNDTWIKMYRKLLASPVFDNPTVLKVWLWALLKATHQIRQLVIGYQTITLNPGEFIYGRFTAAEELKMKESTVRNCLSMLAKLGNLDIKPTNKFSIVYIKNWTVYQELGQQIENKVKTKHQQSATNNNVKNVKNVKNYDTVAFATSIKIGVENMTIDELTYEPIDERSAKSKYGKKTMFLLARCYLDTAGITLVTGETYDAGKISKSLSKLLKQFKSPDRVMEVIREAGEYFNAKGLEWTPEAVWRDWELIQKWKTMGKKIDSSILI